MVRIQSEEEAFRLLDEILSGKRDKLPSVSELKIDDWATSRIYMPKVPIDGSLNAPMMAACVEYQQAIYRIVADAKYNTKDLRYLHTREKAAFQVTFAVGAGSTSIRDNLNELINNLGSEVIKNMDSEDILILILGVALIFGGYSAFKLWLTCKSDIQKETLKDNQAVKQLETFTRLSEQETKRAEILDRALQKSRVLRDTNEEAERVRDEYLKAIEATEDTEIQGTMISKSQAHTLRNPTKRTAEKYMMTDVFRVLVLDTSDPDTTSVKIESVKTGQKISASFEDGILEQNGLDLLTYAAAHRKTVWIKLQIRALDGKIQKAGIGEVRRPDYSEDE
ncbi:hypothetical protein [Kordiimonas pumila]|uniref:Uncharacterized protein n=1 Tax=Kordiimonas pumila TaxID=2161677 RepID=A0ABV7D014_9PROT|nr:hypothetical protein [Kordiimonas pumila]